MVLIDLQKAFDTIDHSILLEKMSCLGFAGKTIAWYTSYLTNRSFIVNVGKEFSSPGKLSCGVPQSSILGPLLFLLYVNHMPQAVNSELLLYADDTCLIYMGKNIPKIEEQLNSDFTSLCEWFIDNKLSVHFGEEKTKSILFGTKPQLKDQRDLNLKYGDIEIKQHSRVTYLGCILDNILSGEHIGCKSIKHSKQPLPITNGGCHFDQKSSTQRSGNLPKIETQKSGNPNCQAFRLHEKTGEKTYYPDQKVLDINSTFQFYLLYQRILLFNFCFMIFVHRVLNLPQPLSV